MSFASRLAGVVLALAPSAAFPQEVDDAAIARRALEAHILPGYATLAAETADLAETADGYCAGKAVRPVLESAYDDAFDAWIGVSHLRFGPVEQGDRAFAIAFWPDTRGFTPRTLEGLIRDEDPIVDDPTAFAEVSVAGRGLFALDWLLFDEDAPAVEPGSYPCRLLEAISADLARLAAETEAAWRDGFGVVLTSAGAPDNPLYFTPEEASGELYQALIGGLQATLDLRLERPLAEFDRPRPRLAEAWRSGRPLRNVELSIAALRGFTETAFLPELDPASRERVLAAFDRAEEVAGRIEAPLTDAVADPLRRVRVESLVTELRDLRETLAQEIGAPLGATLGFNSLDGD